MPRTFQFNETLECDRETAWRIFTDWESWRNVGAWGDIRWTQGEPWKKGSKRIVEVKLPFVYPVEQTVTAVEPAEHVTLLGHGAVYTSISAHRFRDLGANATEFSVTIEIEGAAADFFGKAFEEIIPKTIQQLIDDMKSRCREAGQKPSPS